MTVVSSRSTVSPRVAQTLSPCAFLHNYSGTCMHVSVMRSTDILLNFTGMATELKSIAEVSEQTKSNTEQIGTIKAEHEEMNSKMNELESNLEEMQETMAETRADVANIQSQQSNSGSRGVEGAMRMFQINQAGIVNIQFNLPFQQPTTALADLIPSSPFAQGL